MPALPSGLAVTKYSSPGATGMSQLFIVLEYHFLSRPEVDSSLKPIKYW